MKLYVLDVAHSIRLSSLIVFSSRHKLELVKPIVIGNNVWIGASVNVLPGVEIGDNVTIGAGSVVIKPIPANCVAAGNPCRVLRMLGTGSSSA